MEVKKIQYTVKNKIAYEEYETISLVADITEGEDITQVYNQIKEITDKLRRDNIEDLDYQIREKRRVLRGIEEKINSSIAKWEQLRSFYSAQGIKELADIPQFNNLLPPVVEGEIVENPKPTSTTYHSDEF